ncbi:MAG: amidohydrolase family protein [Sphingomonas sp.]|jgi:cytosine/adenosine deaminase-related metal-dependent hydrolase|uniref:amidohydrolase family protein n=1 Tax=Sphingomonas sp. TaxID=28214 RepID=UPI003569C60F
MRLLLIDDYRRVAIEGGVIVEAEGRFDATLDCRDAIVCPGLINAHDHLHRNHYGRLGNPPYANAYRWAEDIQRRHAREIALGRLWPRRAALLEGAWKNLFAGVTTVVHHDRWEGDFDADFPIRVARVTNADSLGMSGLPDASRDAAFCLHVAEGVDAAAAEEVRTLDRAGLLGPGLIGVHGVGMDADGIARWRAAGAALCWCPSSNLFLFGRTASAELFAGGVDVLLGSDALLTGAGDLLDELRIARRLCLLGDSGLAAAVGATAARRLGLPAPDLAPGSAADLLIMSRPLGTASAADIQLVMVGGQPRVAGTAFAEILAPLFPGCRPMRRGALRRWVWGETHDESETAHDDNETGTLVATSGHLH